MNELKRKYEQAMRDVLHILGKYDYQYIKEYVEDLEKTFIQLEQSYDSLWDSVHHNPSLEKALNLYIEWTTECGFGYDNIPEEYEKYKKEIKDMGYNEGLKYIALKEVEE